MAKKLIKMDELVLYSTDFSAYKIQYQKIDGDGTKRNLQGTMRRQVVANKIKIVVKTKELMNAEKMSKILEKITRDTFQIEFWNTKTRAYQTIDCYASAPEPEIDLLDDEKDEITYKALSMDFIEL